MTSLIEPVQKALSHAHRVCFFTGAGVSAESGVPTFRDKLTGLWANFKPEQLASRQGFETDPERVWQWYQMRRKQLSKVKPNPAHDAITAFQQREDKVVNVVTQNVDGLHQRAGSQDVIELHGNIHGNHCFGCEARFTGDVVALSVPPSCPKCGDLIRPSVVWFGETLPMQAWASAEHIVEACDVFFTIGTSSVVYPAAGLIQLAKSNGAMVIEVNPNPTDNSCVDVQIAQKAGECLPQLLKS